MLTRTLEPEIMDSEQDAAEYNRMDHRSVNVQFVDDLLQMLAQHGLRLRESDDPEFDDLDEVPEVVGSFLDVGTGTALIPIELCKRSPCIRVMGIDMATSMLDLGIRNVDIACFRDQIQLAQIDAKDTEFEDAMFDGVISNSIIHHIANPESTVEEMIRTTRDGGIIFVRDLMRPASAAEVDSLVSTYAGEESDYCQRLLGESLHAALTLNEMRELVASSGFDEKHCNRHFRPPLDMGCRPMKQILAIIKPYIVEKVISAIAEFPIEEIDAREVKGFGRQKNYLDRYRENEYSDAFIPKIELSIWCQDEDVERIVDTLVQVSRTGRLGDGKIMIMPVITGRFVTES